MPKTNGKPSLRTYEVDTLGLPPLKFVLGEVPSPNPDGWHKGKKMKKSGRDIEVVVNRLIVHLKDTDQ